MKVGYIEPYYSSDDKSVSLKSLYYSSDKLVKGLYKLYKVFKSSSIDGVRQLTKWFSTNNEFHNQLIEVRQTTKEEKNKCGLSNFYTLDLANDLNKETGEEKIRAVYNLSIRWV